MNIPNERKSRRTGWKRDSASCLVLTVSIEENEGNSSNKNIFHSV